MLHGRALRGRLVREGPQRLRSAHIARRGEILSCGAAHFFRRARHAAAITVIGHGPARVGEGLSTDAVERRDEGSETGFLSSQNTSPRIDPRSDLGDRTISRAARAMLYNGV